jgi:spore germination cell wall hydrolase CwlJ-like protein
MQISNGVWKGTIPDPTAGADHYFNPKLVRPSWAKKMKKTYTSEAHDYYKE